MTSKSHVHLLRLMGIDFGLDSWVIIYEHIIYPNDGCQIISKLLSMNELTLYSKISKNLKKIIIITIRKRKRKVQVYLIDMRR